MPHPIARASSLWHFLCFAPREFFAPIVLDDGIPGIRAFAATNTLALDLPCTMPGQRPGIPGPLCTTCPHGQAREHQTYIHNHVEEEQTV